MSRLINFFKVPRNAFLSLFVLVLLIASFILRAPSPHVSLAAEPLLEEGPKWLTNALITTFIVDLIIIILAVATRFSLKDEPTGFGNFMEFVVETLYGLVESVAGKNARKFFPWVATIFIIVILSNYSGLIPGVGSIGLTHGGGHTEEHKEGDDGHGAILNGEIAMADGKIVLFDSPATTGAEEGYGKFVPLFRAPSADLNMTFALAIITMFMVQFWGLQALGAGYLKKFFNFSGSGAMKAINIFSGILELVSEFAKIISFAFRLFGNIFAGEVLLAVMAFLITFLIPVPFYGLELFVGFIQALVFMMLAVVFFSTAVVSHDHGDHH